MLRKLIAYQRLLLNSTPPINMNSNDPLMVVTYILIIVVMTFMNMFIFILHFATKNQQIVIHLHNFHLVAGQPNKRHIL